MSQSLIEELAQEHLCTYYVLPLLKLNKFSFPSSNFVNCYLTRDGSKVIVQVMELLLVPRKVIKHSRHLKSLTDSERKSIYLIFAIPGKWRHDVSLFIQGKFSAMSKPAKSTIRIYSGLDYKIRKEGKILTDGRLLALDRHPVLKQMWESELSSDDKTQTGRIELDEEDELLDIPGERSYINPEGLIQI